MFLKFRARAIFSNPTSAISSIILSIVDDIEHERRRSLREEVEEVEVSSPHSVHCRAAPSSTSPARPSRKVARKTSSPTSDVEFVQEEMDLMAPQPVKVERKGNSFEVTYRYSKRS